MICRKISDNYKKFSKFKLNAAKKFRNGEDQKSKNNKTKSITKVKKKLTNEKFKF